MHIRSLDTDGFVRVVYPKEIRLKVLDAMMAWQRFCRLPRVEKFKLAGGDRIDDFGYMLRNDSGPKADNKEQFHLVKVREPELMQKASMICDPSARKFISAGDDLIEAISPLILEFAAKMESEYKMRGFVEEVLSSKHLWTFRFLHYFGGETLANAHADRLGFTLHLYESDDGGEYLDWNLRWRPWHLTEEQTIIFPSIGLQHRSDCQVKALWHRVVPTEETRRNGRYAMVAFIDFPQVREWDKVKYPRVQAFAPGFNYGMSFRELDSYFTQAAEVAA